MWKPISKLDYLPLSAEGRVIVVACPMLKRNDELRARWTGRAVAVIGDSSRYLRDIARDILANPQIRGIVFDGPACGRTAYDKFWTGTEDPGWRIDKEHVDLIRQFVDLFDDDCNWRTPPQPFWPVRVAYLEETESK